MTDCKLSRQTTPHQPLHSKAGRQRWRRQLRGGRLLRSAGQHAHDASRRLTYTCVQHDDQYEDYSSGKWLAYYPLARMKGCLGDDHRYLRCRLLRLPLVLCGVLAARLRVRRQVLLLDCSRTPLLECPHCQQPQHGSCCQGGALRSRWYC